MAEVAVSRQMLADVLPLIARLRHSRAGIRISGSLWHQPGIPRNNMAETGNG
jgi:hypothetical protein